jgi:hypothetical protein
VELEFEQVELEGLRRSTVSLLLDVKLLGIALRLKAGYRADQPRVPAGNPDGGQWTDGDDSSRVVGVARRRANAGQVRVGNRWLSATPAQQLRLSLSQSAMRKALRDVLKLDPKWRPTPQAYETIEGAIQANRATELEAQFRIFEFTHARAGPGQYVKEWIPAPLTNRRLNNAEQAEINRLGRKWGCHRCGSKDPSTGSGNFVGDHQMPRALGTPTRIYPHCLPCSKAQGGIVTNYRNRSSQ